MGARVMNNQEVSDLYLRKVAVNGKFIVIFAQGACNVILAAMGAFSLTPLLVLRGMYGIIFGDIFMKCVYRIRPYEAVPGSADAMHE